MKKLLVTILVLCSFAQAADIPAATALVKAQMLNPDSFVLESAGTYSNKKITDAVFLTFRSQNRSGGYSKGCATVAVYKGKLRVNITEDSDLAGAEICASNAKHVTPVPVQ
jgi:hypothetical protein